jgi:hypothetical protein
LPGGSDLVQLTEWLTLFNFAQATIPVPQAEAH